jgi:hypothetical protein
MAPNYDDISEEEDEEIEENLPKKRRTKKWKGELASVDRTP